MYMHFKHIRYNSIIIVKNRSAQVSLAAINLCTSLSTVFNQLQQ